jgi:integrase
LRGLIDALSPARMEGHAATVAQLLDRWLLECERMDLSPTTMRNYRSQAERVLRPRLGKVALTRLTARHLDELYGAMKDQGKSAKTIRNLHATVSSALHQAQRWGWVRDNVAELAKPPRIAQRRVRPPSVEDVQAVIEAAEERYPWLAPMLLVAALTGMRRGELCALRWSCTPTPRSSRWLDRSWSSMVASQRSPRRPTASGTSRSMTSPARS